ncbi:hypothetical protein [Clostridium sp. BL-8]|uniref:hypothetical protein n=1 Tax=Clostridium sp. BL-8 TaxID=349938 RepID=UPI00098CA46B|nr:hypothetical protein [Clostridium sp. BL-8]OOM76596.1 hypothetical protein CLOBL_34810 [Clostridium sp. BL-8]
MLEDLVAVTGTLNRAHRISGVGKRKILRESFGLRDKEKCWEFYNNVHNMMVGINIKDFLNIYPIKKKYDGDKYEMKDYYSSKQYIDTLLSVTDTFNEDNIAEFLMETQLDEVLFEQAAISMMMGVSYQYEKLNGVSPLDMFFNYGARSNNKETNYLKVVN